MVIDRAPARNIGYQQENTFILNHSGMEIQKPCTYFFRTSNLKEIYYPTVYDFKFCSVSSTRSRSSLKFVAISEENMTSALDHSFQVNNFYSTKY